MSKQWKPGKQTVQLAPSRIRRDPARLEAARVKPPSREREAWGVVAGVLLFAAAMTAFVFDIGEITSHSGPSDVAPAGHFDPCYAAAGANCVLDGATIFVGGEQVALAGVDAPRIRGAACEDERNQGIAAAVRLRELLNSGQVTVTGAPEPDLDGRPARHVLVDGRDAATALIKAGVARKPRAERRDWCS